MATDSLRVLIAGGGTGGHIIPALAVARELAEHQNAEIRFVGTARGLETRLVPAAGFPLDLIEVGQLNRVSLVTKIKTMAALPLSVLACTRLLKKFQPHVVFGVGGYASGPAMMAAIATQTPLVVFEPNAVPGMANRIVGRWVTAAAVNFAATRSHFRNATVTGIPVRPEFFHLPPQSPHAPPHLLIFGGSQGARIFNRTLPQIAPTLLEAIPGLTILHQCGARHVEETQQAYELSAALREHSHSWRVQPFLDDMPQRFAAASLVLCRSGASTMAELAAAARPSLLVPFPLAADDHQRRNAEVFVEAGAAILLPESGLTPETLLAELLHLLLDPAQLQQMGHAAHTLANPNAAAAIAHLIHQSSSSNTNPK